MTDGFAADRAIVHTNGALQLVESLERGGKILSIRDTRGIEWLAQRAGPVDRPARRGDSFTKADMCGWDECAPTIDACVLDGAAIPDHGEAWDSGWSGDRHGATVVLDSISVELSRRISLPDEHTIVLGYRARALSRSTPFLWAAHPQFAAPPGTRVDLGGRELDGWDVSDADRPRRLRVDDTALSIGALSHGTSRKIYADPGQPVDSVALVRPDGARLELSWDAGRVPYLGIWFDRSNVAAIDVIALEPTTGWYDSLASAAASGRVSLIAPEAALEWELVLRLS